jgi:hypothetical protein
MEIKVESDQLELVQTGWFQTFSNEDVRLKIPPLTFVFRFISSEKDKDKPAFTHVEIDSEKLILTLVVEGQIPAGPFAHLSTRPWEVGTVRGTPIFLSYKIERPMADQPQVEIFYTVYKKQPNPISPPITLGQIIK